MTPSEAPKALQASECSELLDLMRASFWITAQHKPGKFTQYRPLVLSPMPPSVSCTQQKCSAKAAREIPREGWSPHWGSLWPAGLTLCHDHKNTSSLSVSSLHMLLPFRVCCSQQSAVPRQHARLPEQAQGMVSPMKNHCDKQVSSWRHISCHTDKNRYYT